MTYTVFDKLRTIYVNPTWKCDYSIYFLNIHMFFSFFVSFVLVWLLFCQCYCLDRREAEG